MRTTLKFADLRPDLRPTEAPETALTSGFNIVFKNGEVQRSRTLAAVLTSRNVKGLVFCRVAGDPVWVYFNEVGVWSNDGVTETDITPASGWTGAGGAIWTATTINGFPVLNATDRDPVYWPLSGPCLPLPDWPAGGRCYAIREHRGFLFAVGFFSESGQRLRWSDAAEAGSIPQSWDPAADNFAGFVDLSTDLGDVLEARTMRDELIVYKRQSISAAQFIGGNTVFAFRSLFNRIGIAGTEAMCEGLGDRHAFFGDAGDVYVHDGVNIQSLLAGRLQRAVYAEIGEVPEPAQGYFGATLRRENIGVLGYPVSGQRRATRALTIDWETLAVGWRELPETQIAAEGSLAGVAPVVQAEDDTTDDVVLGTETGALRVGGDAGISYASNVGKEGLAFDDASRRKMVTRLWPKIAGTPGEVVQFRVAGQETADGPLTFYPDLAAPALDYALNSDGPVDVLATGRFISIYLQSESAVGDWRLVSLDVEYEWAGRW